MRRRLLALGFTVALFGVFPASAWAPHHLMLVNEVYPAATPGQQFVELKDPAGEPFPNPTYTLAVHDGAGMLRGSQTFTTFTGNPFAGTTDTYLVGQSPPADATLMLPLPLAAGQVCFYHDGPTDANRINCLGYGNVTNPLPTDSGATAVVASLPAGTSAQRLASGSVCAGTPTRDAENACGGVGGGDTTDPVVAVSRKKKQDVDKVVLSVTTNEATTVKISASVSIPGAAKTLRFKTVTRSLTAGVKRKIRLRLKRSRKKAVKKAIAGGARPRARVKMTATDAAGNATVKRTKIRLKN